MLPKRVNNVIYQSIGEETVVYSANQTTVHNLHPTASKVYHLCNGENDLKVISQESGLDQETVLATIHQLREQKLLQATTSRREALKAVSTAVAAPLILSITLSEPAAASSTISAGTCSGNNACNVCMPGEQVFASFPVDAETPPPSGLCSGFCTQGATQIRYLVCCPAGSTTSCNPNFNVEFDRPC